MDNGSPSSTNGPADQQNFRDLYLYQQVYITDLVQGPAAAIAFARRARVDLQKSDWWRVALTKQAPRALEDEARTAQIERAGEVHATLVPHVIAFDGKV
jgi:hypothetical protein